MNFLEREYIKGLRQMFALRRREPSQQAARIVVMLRNIVLPAKLGIVLVVLYYLYYSGWSYDVPTLRSVWQDTLKGFFPIYIFCNLAAFVMLRLWRRFPPAMFQWLAFTLGLLDGLFVAGLIIVTGGFESIAFWVFPGLIVLNAISIPLAMPQIVLNLCLSALYLMAGFQNPKIGEDQTVLLAVPGRSSAAVRSTNSLIHSTNSLPADDNADQAAKPRLPFWVDDKKEDVQPDEISPESFLLRVVVLWLLTACCYAVQVLAERQRRLEEEAHEIGLRQGQLRSAGRLAAEFAHQIKNPLAIINNANFSLRRAVLEGRGDPNKHLQIIAEEIQRADKIVTQIMGYAQLNEGQIVKLNLAHELSLAVAQVFPIAAEFPVKIECRCETDLPLLFMQKNHLDEILVNIFQNARDALGKSGGKITATARRLTENLIEIAISNNGPEIPADKLERIFEAHYTTKETGTGLGLAIVKHNVELYAGTVRAESKLGKGVRFILVFPAKTVINPDQKFQTS
jgi:signal transduction histidine kinase